MNKEVCSVLKDRVGVSGVSPFFEVIAGLAQTLLYQEPTENGSIQKRMPVTYDVFDPDNKCPHGSPETYLVPDNSKKGILYFEDAGSNVLSFDPLRGGSFSSNVTLVCWLNKERLGYQITDEISAKLATKLLAAICLPAREGANVSIFNKFHVSPARVNSQDNAVFARYTYPEEATQYLRPPFEYFSINLLITYEVNAKCIADLPINEPICY